MRISKVKENPDRWLRQSLFTDRLQAIIFPIEVTGRVSIMAVL